MGGNETMWTYFYVHMECRPSLCSEKSRMTKPRSNISKLMTSAQLVQLLESYLYGFSLPIDVVFSQVSLNPSSKTPGAIKLETVGSSTRRIVLWVYYNVFLRVELCASEKSKSVNDLFDKLIQNLCSGIKKDSVDEKDLARYPDYSRPEGPHKVEEGKSFTVEVTTNHENYHQVFCETNVCFNLLIYFPSVTANVL